MYFWSRSGCVSASVGVEGVWGLCVMMFLWNPIEFPCLLTSTNTHVADQFRVLDFAHME